MNTPQRVGAFLKKVATAPPTQLEEQACTRLREIAEAPTEYELEEFLGRCARYSLASDFVMVVLDAALNELRKQKLQ
jgi:hypothetical protein